MKGYNKVHAIAVCEDCEWEEQGWTIAQEMARKHHKETGHEVNLEVGYSKIYTRKESSE